MNGKKIRKLYMTAFMFFLIISIVDVPSAIAQGLSPTPYKEKQILILIGPHYGIPMLEAITPAIVNTLREKGFSLDDIFVEFLDLHRHPGPQHRSNILALLETKLKDKPIGLIITVNQGAVDFVAREGKNLLAGVPMLIPILEKLPEWEGEPRKLITLTSHQDAEGTLGYALALFPETKRVFLIMGKDDHEAPFLAPILKALDDLPEKLNIETTADLPYEKMLERVATLSRDTIAFYGSVFHDITGRSFVPAEVAGRIAETANCPVFAFRDMHIVQGLAGGSVTITSDLGKQAALIGLDYLAGNLLLAQPVTPFEVPNAPLFDWRQLKRRGGDVGTLPAGTIFLNRPPTIWSQYKEAVIITLTSFILLSFLVVALLVTNGRLRAAIRKRKQAKAELADEAGRRRLLLEQSRDGIVILDQDGQVYESNRKFAEMLGYPLDSMGQLNVTDWEVLHSPERAMEMIRSVNEKGDHFETRHRRRDGSTYNVEISSNAAWFAGQKLVFCICRDITDRKRAEEKMAEQLHELQRWHNVMLDREDRVIELKRDVNELCRRLGEPPRHASVIEEGEK